MSLPIPTNECALDVSTDICMESSIIEKIIVDAQINKKIAVNNEKDAISALKQIYNCQFESCLLKKQEIKNIIGNSEAADQLNKRFKPSGPWDSVEWFSNVNIDNILKQAAKQYQHKKFLHIPFQMRDFKDTNGELNNIDIVDAYRNGCKCFGVVFNTDYSTGNGKHWFCVYGSFESTPLTIEFFDSSGSNPLPEIREWMANTKLCLQKELNKQTEIIIASKTQFQYDNHSCGSYSLYYILSRLKGMSHDEFTKKNISDALMHEFRRNLFRKEI
jgi:hypothetical protein